MEKTHSESFTVRATECDRYRRMRPDALFLQMQEGGERHAVSLGFGHGALLEKGIFFVLARIHVLWNRAPHCGETICHTTWPGTANRFFCPRYHTFASTEGETIASVSALWLLLDTNERKIMNPLKCGLEFPDTSDIPIPASAPAHPPQLTGETTLIRRAPVYSEFDINGHVNNTKYIAWLCDALGPDVLAKAYPAELTASYEKEIRSTDPFSLSLTRSEDAFLFSVSSDGAKYFTAGGSLRREVDLHE